MRVSITFARQEPVSIPADYRRRFISFLKSALIDEFPQLYEKGVVKPYTFAVVFNRGVKVSRDKIDGVRVVVFKFSSGREDVVGRVVNYAIRVKKEGRGIGFGREAPEFTLREIRVQSRRLGDGYFRTLSPIVVNNPDANPHNPKEHFILPDDERYEERLYTLLRSRMETLTGHSPQKFEFHPLEFKEVMVRHYRGFVRGFVGKFNLEADPLTLSFVYDYGLGIRTGQGFGMVDSAW